MKKFEFNKNNLNTIMPYLAPMFLVTCFVLYLFVPQIPWLASMAFVFSFFSFIALIVVKRTAIKNMLQKRGSKRGIADLAGVLIVLAIVVIVNYIFSNHQIKKDFTKTQINSLSEQSINVIKGLKEDVHFTGFFKTTDAFLFRKAMDMYTYYSGKIKFEVIDPNQEPVKTRNYNVNKYGVVIVSAGPESSEVRLDEVTEESLTNALIKMTRKEKKSVYFVTDHGERNIEGTSEQGDSLSELKKSLEGQSYSVSNISLMTAGAVPADAKVLVIAGATKSFFDKEIELLNTFFEQGGSILVLSDPSSPQQLSKPADNIGKFLIQKGIKLRDDLIVDPMSRLFGVGEAMPVVQTYDTTNKITANFKAATFYPFSQSIDITAIDRDKYDVTELCKTTQSSWGETGSKQGSISYNEGADTLGPLTLAVAVTAKTGDKKGTLIVFGNSSFAVNQYISHAGNADMIMNTISYLIKDEDLISIRPKEDEKGTFVMPVGRINFVAIVSVWLLPVLLLTGGIVFWYRRRKL